MTDRSALPSIHDLPIPADVRVGKGWTAQMIEMADHIGAYAVLQIVDRLGGEYITVPADPSRGRLGPIIGPEKAAIMSEVYRRERMMIPTAKTALAVARRAGVLAAVREGRLTGIDATRILRTSRTYLAQLLNGTDEGREASPIGVRSARNPRQIELFDE